MQLYAASIAAAKNGNLTIGTKSILAQSDVEARELAERSCLDEFPVKRGYVGHIVVVQPIREGQYKGSDGKLYVLSIDRV